MPRKVFSVDDANRTLPLVSRIVRDIVSQHARWRDRVREFELLAAGATPADDDPAREALEREIQEIAAEIQGYVGELEQIGVAIKDFSIGLVDFPGELEGRRVWLCWRLGEPAVMHWHEIHAGFAGRQPLAPRAVA